MIVIGVDVHKQELTAVAIDELGRELADWSGPLAEGLLSWAGSLEGKRRWALEDCRHVSRGLERLLLEAGEQLVRVPPG
jgi:transposase